MNTQIVAQERTPMPSRTDFPVTEDTLRLAREAQAAERARATRECGLTFDDDGHPLLPIESDGIPLAVRVACGEAIKAAVKAYGLKAVERSVRLVAGLQAIQEASR